MSLVILQSVKNVTHDGDWTISTHTRHGPKEYDRPHVHIKKKGLKGEYSWNKDGTRHDAGKFPASEKFIKRAKDHAATALGLPASVFELITVLPGKVHLHVRDHMPSYANANFTMYVHKGNLITILGCEKGLVIVIDEE